MLSMGFCLSFRRAVARSVSLPDSGRVPDPIWGTFYVHPPEKHARLDRDKLLLEVTNQHSESLFAPGTDSSYSNLGYAILGALIEAATGLRWERYIQDEILDPLGMSRSGSDPTRLSGLANSYVSRSLVTRLAMGRVMPWIEFTPEGKFRSIQREYFFDLPAHGGLAIAPMDLERFVRAVVLRDSNLMSADAWDAWLEPQDDAGGEYSLGWRVVRLERGTVLFHSGGAMGHSAHVRIYVDEEVGTFAQTNILDSRSLVRRDMDIMDEMVFETF